MSDYHPRSMRGTFPGNARRRGASRWKAARGGHSSSRREFTAGSTCSAVCMHRPGCTLFTWCSRYRVDGARNAGGSGSGFGPREP